MRVKRGPGRLKNKAIICVLAAAAIAGLYAVSPYRLQRGRQVVSVTAVEEKDMYYSVQVSGTVEDEGAVWAKSDTSGAVEEVYVTAGQQVREGDALLAVRPAQVIVPQVTAERVAALWQQVAGGYAGEPEAAAAAAVAALFETAQDGQRPLQVLTAPCDGTVMSLPQVGETVLAGLPAAQVSDLSQLCILADIPQQYAGQVQPGQTATVTIAGTGTVTGSVTRLQPFAVSGAFSLTGESAVTVQAVVEVEPGARQIRPGYTATVKIVTRQQKDALAVPYEAVTQRGEQEYLFVLEGDRVRQVPVTTHLELEELVQVIGEVEEGMLVVLSPSDTLQDGTPVRVEEP